MHLSQKTTTLAGDKYQIILKKGKSCHVKWVNLWTFEKSIIARRKRVTNRSSSIRYLAAIQASWTSFKFNVFIFFFVLIFQEFYGKWTN